MHHLLIPLMVLTPAPPEAVKVSARVEAADGGGAIVVEVTFGEGWDASKAGIPAPILQIDVPPSVQLTGKVLKTRQELSRNEFLHEPFERLIEKSPLRIGFKLTGDAADTERFGLNVLAYVGDGSTDAWFVRQRLELAITPGSTGKLMPATTSHWGEEDVLQIGDKAVGFTLPKADRSKVSLKKYLGKKNVIVTTYRAHW